MRLALFGDAHGDARTSGVRRHDEVVRGIKQVFRVARIKKVDKVGFLGDLGNPEHADTYRILGVLRKEVDEAAKEGIGFFAIAGNHDVFEDGVDAGRSVLAALGHWGVHEHPGLAQLTSRDGVVTPAIMLPFTPSWAPYDPGAELATALEKLDPGEKALVFGHLNCEGIHPGSEMGEYRRGREVFWPLDLLEPNVQAGRLAAFGGHIHRRQRYRGVEIVGSLARLDHGEEDNEPRFLVVEV